MISESYERACSGLPRRWPRTTGTSGPERAAGAAARRRARPVPARDPSRPSTGPTAQPSGIRPSGAHPAAPALPSRRQGRDAASLGGARSGYDRGPGPAAQGPAGTARTAKGRGPGPVRRPPAGASRDGPGATAKTGARPGVHGAPGEPAPAQRAQTGGHGGAAPAANRTGGGTSDPHRDPQGACAREGGLLPASGHSSAHGTPAGAQGTRADRRGGQGLPVRLRRGLPYTKAALRQGSERRPTAGSAPVWWASSCG